MDIPSALRSRGFRQRDLAQRVGVPESTVSRWMAWAQGRDGGVAIPSTALAAIADMAGIPPADLLRDIAQRAGPAAVQP